MMTDCTMLDVLPHGHHFPYSDISKRKGFEEKQAFSSQICFHNNFV